MIYAGSATQFARDLGDIRTLGNAFALAIISIFIYKNKIHFTKHYFKAIAIFITYALITAVYYRVLSLWWISVHFLLLTYTFIICKGFGRHFFAVFETLLYYLSLISLPFWLLQLMFPDFLSAIVSLLEFSQTYAEDSNVLANMLIYTLNDPDYGIQDFQLVTRNPGFMWEPGAFASMLCLGIYCNMLRTNLQVRGNRSLWVFVLTLITTQSTTGLIIFLGILFFSMITKNNAKYLLFVIPLLYLISTFPFVQDKLMEEIGKTAELDYTMASGAQGRFFSLMLDYQEFLAHPFLGLGCNFQNTLLYQEGYEEISTISGIGDLISIYGLIMSALFFYLLIKSSLFIGTIFHCNKSWFLIFILFGIMISYSLWKTPIISAFWMFCYFYDSGKTSSFS